MRRTPLFSGIIYIILGLLFTYLATQNIQREDGWGLFTVFLIIIATFDLGSGLRMVAFHFKWQKELKNK